MSTSAPRTPASILIIEDAAEFRSLISNALKSDGHRVHAVDSGAAGIEWTQTARPDVIILDLTLPDIDGIEVCRSIRTFTDAYILMVTARDDEVDRVVGLSIGADDYITKPFSVRELSARVQTVLRRPRTPSRGAADTRTFNDLQINTLAREVALDGEVLSLTKIEFDLIETLSQRPEMVYTRAMLIESVWGPHWVGDDHVVDVHIANLRKKIDLGGRKHIKTVRGVGYRLDSEGSSVTAS